MRWGSRVLACACATPLVLAVTPLAAAPAVAAQVPAQDRSQDRSQSSSFIAALAAIPDATAALEAAKTARLETRVQAQQVQAVADAAHLRLDAATERVHEAAIARTHADIAFTATQSLIDQTARELYTSGGTVPSLAEVLLTSNTTEGFTRSLLTREYLASTANNALVARDAAADAAQAAATAGAAAQQERTVVADDAARADAAAQAAATTLAAADAAVKQSKAEYKRLMKITSADRSAEYGRIKKCGDWVTRLLSRSGFEGENLREAWAIVMRESGGREDAISASNDLGLFQINTATWKSQPWFDRKALLTRKYNAKIGHLLSQGGSSWYSWGLDGHGRPDAGAYVRVGWTPEHITASIIKPYVAWYAQYPCRPAYEEDNPYPLTPARALEPAVTSAFDGAGVQPGSSDLTVEQ